MDSRAHALTQWLATFFEAEPVLTLISGDASFRRYFRFQANGSSWIAVDAPVLYEDCRWFGEVAQAYQAQGLKVPQVLQLDEQQGFMWLSDLGDELLSQSLTGDNVGERYRAALKLLHPIRGVNAINGTPLPSYDDAMLSFELSIFKEWLVEKTLAIELNNTQQQMLHDTFTKLTEMALEQPQVGVHRDYHSRNLMCVEDELAVIDFQGCVNGPITYDLVSLLRDCYVRWPNDLVTTLLQEQYQQLVCDGLVTVSWPEFERWFDWMGLQRHIKAAGIFCRLNLRDNKAGYLKDVPLTLTYLVDISAKYPEFAAFHEWLTSSVVPAWERQS
ncbi:cell wall phosphotransferase [Paraferrimonas haliotis]|uniref:Cell wall phosphotransferase n=1 Tax=Paraferrimonas haliotis TaxID=2013866 RepID=A0AA37TMG8_9GAMM|nr:phosphotransferase [Paraferrimonas haliotis]GLS82388.1 cell wall phosphotransferase [Paraferrimonas haliotis]